MIKIDPEPLNQQILRYLGYAFIARVSYDLINYASPILYKKIKT